jgi:hypothetical protein
MLTKSEDAELLALPLGPWDHTSMAHVGLERYSLVILGVAIFVLPMVLMVQLQKTNASLATITSCTIVFAVSSAYLFPSKLPLKLLTSV